MVKRRHAQVTSKSCAVRSQVVTPFPVDSQWFFQVPRPVGYSQGNLVVHRCPRLSAQKGTVNELGPLGRHVIEGWAY